MNLMLPQNECWFAPVDGSSHSEMDAYGKANGLTIVLHNGSREYQIIRTGTLSERNEEFPSGLHLMDESGKPIKGECL